MKRATPCTPPAPTWVTMGCVWSLIRSALERLHSPPAESVTTPRGFAQIGRSASPAGYDRWIGSYLSEVARRRQSMPPIKASSSRVG
jgi:hypothetical protein